MSFYALLPDTCRDRKGNNFDDYLNEWLEMRAPRKYTQIPAFEMKGYRLTPWIPFNFHIISILLTQINKKWGECEKKVSTPDNQHQSL